MAVAHRQVASIRNRIFRGPRVMRAATCRTRYREGVDLAVGQNRLVGEPDEFRPEHQIGCRQDYLQPCGVGIEPVTGQVGQPGRLGLADAVLHACVLPVPQFGPAELACHHTGSGVGDECGDPQPVGVGERLASGDERI
jgi:hypothetical protein